ncbi:MAG TPA: histidine kinase [Ilumatobacteraceae bacterium]|nr:histidine kinase [Ilumatobacteraceae bacterium]
MGLLLAGWAAGACSIVLALSSDHVRQPGVQASLMVWIVLSCVVAGVIAWWNRPGRFGPLMIAAGFGVFLSSLSWSNNGVLFTLGMMFDLVPAVIFLHLYLAFPTGRLDSPVARVLVISGYVTALGVEAVRMVLGGFGSGGVLVIRSMPDADRVIMHVQLVVLSLLALAGIGVLLARRRGVGRPLRRPLALLIDSFGLGLIMIAFLFLSAAFGYVEGDPAFEQIRRATFFVIGLAPLAYVAGLLNSRLLSSAVGDLVIELQTNPLCGDLRDALARALHDPSLTLAYWLPDFGSYVDLDGHPVTLPAPSDARAVARIGQDGAHVAVLLHDASLNDEPELLDSVVAAAGIALQNMRLQAELRARVGELAGSRARVIEAGQKERQRLERDLHDGAQQRLVALSLELSLLQEQLGGDHDLTTRLDGAKRQIAVSLAELRDVAHGLHPAVVSGHGLVVALEELAAHSPVPIRLTIEIEGRLAEQIEVAAYYMVCESLTNIGKHAQATEAAITVAREAGSIVIEVVDDGVGGADTERGSGIRGLADRIEALGGRLQVWTPRGGGTRVRAEIPCGS